MSKGPGRVQRAIAALIEAEPDDAWNYDDICRKVYGRAPTASNLSAVGRALADMKLPGTSTFGRCGYGDRRRWLYDVCSLASVRKAHPNLHDRHFQPGGSAFERVENAKRWRDASLLEKLDIEIADAQKTMGMLRMAGGRIERADAERIIALQAARAKLAAG
jgi:hypothetical protein